MEQINFQYPAWLILFCLIAGLLYGLLLYYKSKQLVDQNKWLKPTLGMLRFLSISVIAILLLGPMIKSVLEESKSPSVVILKDNSLSVGNWVEERDDLNIEGSLSQLSSELSEKYQVDEYFFGENAVAAQEDTIIYSQEITNLSDVLSYVKDIYEGENLGAIILASDGIYNQGQNPLYSSSQNNIPIYSIALGDTTQRKDVLVQNVLYNEVAYLNDEMLTQVDVRAFNTANQNLRLTVEREDNGAYTNIYSETIRATSDDFFTTINIPLAFDQPGINHYRYRLRGVDGEQNSSNNRKDIYIEVLDARQEIAILGAAPHPDLSALKQLLEQNKNYNISIFTELPSNSELADFDLVFFHQLPARGKNIRNIITSLDNRKIPRVYFVGPQTNINVLNGLQNSVSVSGNQGNSNDSQAQINSNFKNFTISETLKNSINRFPPLASPFGTYNLKGNVETFLYQTIGGISTDFPLLSFSDEEGIKTAFFFGADVWRWKLFDYLQNENFDLITELIDKVSIYVSTKEDRRKFRVSTVETVYFTNEPIVFQAELYNDNYELVNEAEVQLQLFDQEGNKFDYTFSKSNDSYVLDVGTLGPSTYRYTATTTFNGERFEASGRLVVREIQFELYDLEARHNLLFALAQQSGGGVFYPENIADISNQLINQDVIKPIIYQSSISRPLLDFNTLLFALVALLGLEWFIRRYSGTL